MKTGLKIIEYTPNHEFWDIVKGIGIICIMCGHATSGVLHNFFYMFHIPLFLFVSGFLLSEVKWGDKPLSFIKSKLIRLWLPFAIIESLAVAFHNVFLECGLLINEHEYSIKEILYRVLMAFLGSGDEVLVGPIWFLHVLAISIILLEIIVWISRFIERKIGVIVKLIFQLIFISALYILGYYFNTIHHIQFFADAQIAFVLMPYIWLGYFIRNYIGNIEKFLLWPIGIVATAVVVFVSLFREVDYTLGIGFYWMPVVAIIGIYMCLTLSKYLKKLFNVLSLSGKKDPIAFVGTLSFYIMCIHYGVFRIADRIICSSMGNDEKYYNLPVAYTNYWWFYILVCGTITVFISLGIKLVFDKIKSIKR